MNALETLVLEQIGENITSPDVFTDDSTGMAQIRGSLNDAIEEISMVTGTYKRTYVIGPQSGQGFYRLKFTNGSFGWITDAWYMPSKRRLTQTDTGRLRAINPRWMISTGTPEEYFQIGDVIGIYPRPGSTTGLIELTMVVIPERYAEGTDRIKLRDAFKWAAVHYAVSEYHASRGDAASASDHWARYVENVGMQTIYPKANDYTTGFKTNDLVR